jgi:hypothetical protein
MHVCFAQARRVAYPVRLHAVHESRDPFAYDETTFPGVKRSPASGTAAANTAAFQQRYAQRVSATRLDSSHRKSDTLAGVAGEATEGADAPSALHCSAVSYYTVSHGVY